MVRVLMEAADDGTPMVPSRPPAPRWWDQRGAEFFRNRNMMTRPADRLDQDQTTSSMKYLDEGGNFVDGPAACRRNSFNILHRP